MSWFTPSLVGLPVLFVPSGQKNFPRHAIDSSKIEFVSHTISSTLSHRPLAPTTTDTDAVNDIALLGLVSEAARLVRTRRAGCAVDHIELTELY